MSTPPRAIRSEAIEEAAAKLATVVNSMPDGHNSVAMFCGTGEGPVVFVMAMSIKDIPVPTFLPAVLSVAAQALEANLRDPNPDTEV